MTESGKRKVILEPIMHHKDRRMCGDYVMLCCKVITASVGYSQKAEKHIKVILSVSLVA